MRVAVRCTLVCPAGAPSPASADLGDVLDAAWAAARGGKPVAVVMVLHGDQDAASIACDAAAWSLERVL